VESLWDPRSGGYFTVDTAGTKAFIGHAAGKDLTLGEVTITPAAPYAQIYVSALAPDKTIANDRQLLVTTIARSLNKDTVIDRLTRKGTCTVTPLDHDGGRRPDAANFPVRVSGDTHEFNLDGSQTKTMYYLVEWGE